MSGNWVYAGPRELWWWVRDGVYGGPLLVLPRRPVTKVMHRMVVQARFLVLSGEASGNMRTGWITYGSSMVLPGLNWSVRGWFNQGGTWYYLVR